MVAIMSGRQWMNVVNTLAVLLLAGCMAWLYLVRDRVMAAWRVPEGTAPATRAWSAINAGAIDWSGEMQVGGMLARTIAVGSNPVQTVMDRQGSAWMREGWLPVDDGGDAAFRGPFGATRLFRRNGKYRVLIAVNQPDGRSESLILFETGKDWKAPHHGGGDTVECLLEKQSRDLPGIPAPSGTRRFYSLIDAHGAGMVIYVLPGDRRQTVYDRYMGDLNNHGWQRAGFGTGREQMAVLMRDGEMCLVGWNDTTWDNQSFITVVSYGN